jgi:hypothetical protein
MVLYAVKHGRGLACSWLQRTASAEFSSSRMKHLITYGILCLNHMPVRTCAPWKILVAALHACPQPCNAIVCDNTTPLPTSRTVLTKHIPLLHMGRLINRIASNCTALQGL